jgi:hypothetical protein
MWDLTVDTAHSFFVGSGQVLVHNACWSGIPQASQPGKLQNIIHNLFAHYGQPGTAGDGTTMAAVRNEILTETPTGGKWHLAKAWESIFGLNSVISDQATNPADRTLAEQIRADLVDALMGQ